MADNSPPANQPVDQDGPIDAKLTDHEEPARPTDPDSSAEMEDLAASFARVRLLFASSDSGTPEFANRIREMIKAVIAKGQSAGRDSWIYIYEARRLNILLLTPDETLQQLAKALSELMVTQVPGAAALQKAFDDLRAPGANLPQPAATPNRVRLLLLLDVTEAIQWNEQKRYLARRKTNEAARRLVWCWVITFGLFIAPYVYTLYVYASSENPHLTLDAWVAVVPWMVLTAGLMGALFSRLIYLQSNWTSLSLDQVEDAKQWSSIFLRGSVGMCAAVLLFLFVRSGIAGGGLLPQFEEVGLVRVVFHVTEKKGQNGSEVAENVEQAPSQGGENEGQAASPPIASEDKPRAAKNGNQTAYHEVQSLNLGFLAPTPHFALLLIWCFIAGFSERFVQDILAASEKKPSEGAPKS